MKLGGHRGSILYGVKNWVQGRQGTSHGGSEANTHVLPYLVSFTPENRLGSHLVAFKLVLQLVQLLLEVLGAEERGREGGR